MSSLSKPQIISLLTLPTLSGLVSSCASITLIVSILRSELKLTTVYRRLIFLLSVFDVLVSAAHAFSSLPMPAGSMLGAIGSDVTCGLQGFFATVGMCGTVFYSLSLTVYFLLVVKFNMPETKIKKYAEPLLHAFPLLYTLGASTYLYVTNFYNIAGPVCWIAPEPYNCENNPEVECLSTGNPVIARWIGGAGPVFGVFFLNCIILAVIWWSYRSQMRRNQAYGNISSNVTRNSSQNIQSDEEEQLQPGTLCCSFCPMNECPIICKHSNPQSNNSARRSSNPSILADYLSRPSRASIRRLEEISNRAAAYVTGFMLSFIFTIIYRMIDTYGSGSVPLAIVFLSRFFYPLQGFFNVLVYTYPHVTSYRKNYPECNWFKAFWTVIKSGGDSDDQSRVGRRRGNRRGSLRRQQRVLEQSEFRRRSEVMTSTPIINENDLRV